MHAVSDAWFMKRAVMVCLQSPRLSPLPLLAALGLLPLLVSCEVCYCLDKRGAVDCVSGVPGAVCTST